MTRIATPNLDIVRSGRDRLRIRRAYDDAPETHALLAWLGSRPEVRDVEYRAHVAEIHVTYHSTHVGAFVRSLSDRVYALSTPTGRATLRADVLHSLDGRVRFRLTGVDEDDVVRAANWVATQPGVLRAQASPASLSVLVFFDPTVTTTVALTTSLSESDSHAWPATEEAPPRAGFGATLATAVVLTAAVSELVPPVAIGAAIALTALPIAHRALESARQRRLSVDVLDLAAVGISIATGQFLTAASITMLLSIGDRIVEKTSDSARSAISKLMRLDSKEAYRLEDGEPVRVAAEALRVGDRILVDAGACVAADGVVVRGIATIDEKALTGESMPRTKRVGDHVLAATVVLDGQIEVEVERVGSDTTASKIVRILEGAGAKPMTIQRDTERITDRLVMPTIGVAVGAAVLSGQIARATSVLITDFGTGVRIAVPTSALTGLTLAAQSGVLVKGAQYLERLARADTIVFDKTGTLTSGEPEVVAVVTFGDFDEHELLRLAAGAEARQTHPIATALRSRAEALGVLVPEADVGTETVVVGYGLSAVVEGRMVHVGSPRWTRERGHDLAAIESTLERARSRASSSLVVTVDDTVVGVIDYTDTPRPESIDVVRQLRDGGRRRVILLSGDARASVDAVARILEVDEAHGELLPDDKASFVKRLQEAGHVVAMVGDGINDAPALALADVGISLDGGTDVALETADVVLLEGGLARLPRAFALGESTVRNVRRNLALVLVPNAIGIALGALGILNPAAAALVNNGSTVVAAFAAAAPIVTSRFFWKGRRA